MAGRTLQVFIAADTKKFRDGLDDAERRMKGFGGSVGGLAGNFKNVLGPAIAGAGLAAGALAVQFATEGITAAAEQEQANLKLAKAFEAVGQSQDVGKAQEYLAALQAQYGISEDQLYPALQSLVTVTGNLDGAQKLLSIAMDTAKGSGKELEPIVKGLVKAHEGNYGALLKLIPELDGAAVKTGGLKTATDELQKLFGGSAKEQAETFKGKIDRLKLGAGELQEAFGKGFLDGIQGAMDKLDGKDSLGQTMRDLEPTFTELGVWLGTLLTDLATITGSVTTVMKAFNDWKDSIPGLGTVLDALAKGPIGVLAGALRELNALMGANDVTASYSPQGGTTRGSPTVPRPPAGVIGPAPVSSARTPTVVAPVSGLAKATANQALRTSGKVKLLG